MLRSAIDCGFQPLKDTQFDLKEKMEERRKVAGLALNGILSVAVLFPGSAHLD